MERQSDVFLADPARMGSCGNEKKDLTDDYIMKRIADRRGSMYIKFSS